MYSAGSRRRYALSVGLRMGMGNSWNSNRIRRRNPHIDPHLPPPNPCHCFLPSQATTNPPVVVYHHQSYAIGIPVSSTPNTIAPKNLKNTVNLHKHTLTLQLDPNNPHHHLISFHFDAFYDGSFTIFYMAKEKEQCMFSPLFPEVFEPITYTFEKGVGQKFCQPSGTGIDLGFFELDDLSRPSPENDEFPLVICAETSSNCALEATPQMQITQAVLDKSNCIGPFNVKVVRQLLWINDVRYELKELYGTGSSTVKDFHHDNDSEEECVVCMTEPKDTAVLPCRHMCMCSECAKTLQSQSNKCPICRQPIEELVDIKINNDNQ